MPSFSKENFCYLVMEVDKGTGRVLKAFLSFFDPVNVINKNETTQKISVEVTDGISNDSARNEMYMKLADVKHEWLLEYMEDDVVRATKQRWKIMERFAAQLCL